MPLLPRVLVRHLQQIVMSVALPSVLDSLPVAVAVFDRTWEFAYINREAEASLGRAREELMGRKLWAASRQAGEASVHALLRQAMAERSAVEYEGPFLDGQEQYEVWARPLAEGLIVCFRDISERKASEDVLRRSEERLQLMVRSVKDYAIILLDPGGYVVEWNPGAERVKGYRADEILGKHMSTFYPEEDRRSGKPERILAEALAHQHFEDEGWRVRKDGSRFWASVVLTALYGPEGEVVGFAKITRDLTDRHRTEQEHRRRAEMGQLLHTVARISNEAASVEDAFHSTLRRVCDFTGCVVGNVFVPAGAGSDVLVLTDTVCTAEPERYVDFLRATEAARFGPGDGLPGRAWEHVRPAWTPDGAAIGGELRTEAARAAGLRAAFAFPILAAGDVIAVMEFLAEEPLEVDELLLETLDDMGTQLGRIAERRQAVDAIRRANRAKSDFLSRMSHELRTPLNAILGFGQILEMDRLDPEQRESVELILKAGRHLLSLINEVLDIARVESGRIALSPEPVRVRDVVQDALSLLLPLAHERHVLLPTRLPPLAERYVRADRQRLKQVLLNLLSNAIKYNREGGHVTVACADAGEGWLRIGVTDNGPGIPPDKQMLLFSPFERLDAEQSGTEGTGLGLALSKALIEAMGGRIGLESEVSRGSTFWVELPTEPGQFERYEREILFPPLQRPVTAGSGERRSLLYIEDNLSNLKLVQRILSYRPGLDLIPAMQGSLGLELAQRHRPDLILLDLHLPDLRGEEVLLRLQADERTAAIPVIIISADATAGQIQRLRDSGVKDYLAKPFDLRRFLEAVDQALAPNGAGAEG